MTAFGLGSGLPPSDGDLPRRVATLEKQLQMFAAARTLEAATIGAGGLNVTGGGSIRIHDGGTLTIDDGAGNSVPLSQLAFGLKGAANAAAVTPNVYNAWFNGAVTVDFTTATGLFIVLTTCRLVVGSSGTGKPCQGSMSYQLTGAATLAPDRGRGVHYEYNGSGMNTTGQSTFAALHSLTPGAYTVAERLLADCTTSDNNTTFSNRSLIVLPF